MTAYLEIDRNKTHTLWQRSDGKQACLSRVAYKAPAEAQETCWEAAGTWDLGHGGGFRRGHYQTSDFVAEAPARAIDDDRETCICHPEYEPLCPEHGLRCSNDDCDKFVKDSGWAHQAEAGGLIRRFCSRDCLYGTVNREMSREMKASPYQGNDLDQERQREEATFSRPENEVARKRLHAALAAESPRVAAKPFPSVGRDSRVIGSNRS